MFPIKTSSDSHESLQDNSEGSLSAFQVLQETNVFHESGKNVNMWKETSKQWEPFRNIYAREPTSGTFPEHRGKEREHKWQATKETRRVPNPRVAHRNTTYTYSVIIHYLLK